MHSLFATKIARLALLSAFFFTTVPLPTMASAPAVPALVLAAEKGDTAAVRSLLRHGANPNTRDAGGISALEWASAKGRVPAVLALLAAHAAIDGAYNPMHYTPLMRAANFGQVKVAAILIAHGANVNAHDKNGFTPIEFALDNDHPDVVLLLKRHGAKVLTQLYPSMFCTATASIGFGKSSAWKTFANDPKTYACDNVKHDFGSEAGDVIMYTYQVEGAKTFPRYIFLKTEVFMSTIPLDIIAKTLRPLLQRIYLNSGRGPIPEKLLESLLQCTNVQSDTKLGFVRAEYTPGSHPDRPTNGASYSISISLHN